MGISPFKKLVSLSDALGIVLENAYPLERTEDVGLSAAAGRVLARNLVSPMDVPPFDRSAMDGYAVMSEDAAGAGELNPAVLKVTGELFAGDDRLARIGKGEACRVATGAPLPEGADSVIMAEYADEESSHVRVRRAEPRWGNVSRRGSDMRAGADVLTKGAVLDPAKVGVLASLGMSSANVLARPSVAIFSSGNEIAEPGGPLGAAQVYNSNSYTLASLVDRTGGAARIMPRIEDTEDAVRSSIASASGKGFDAVAISGGSSVGERDLLAGVLSSMGEVLFHGVQIKPGKPFLFGKAGGIVVFGIPGYPAACLTVGYIFLAPAVRKMAGLPADRRTVRTRLARRVASRLGRAQILTVKLTEKGALPVFKESGAITSLAAADGYIIIPDDTELVEADEEVEVVLF
jgi:molybdenum cofactor synthesis domain-containing protein